MAEKHGLVLSRRRDESVYIGDPENPDIVIRVVDIQGGKVRMQVKAPPNVGVHRKEVADAITRERRTNEGSGT